jgi:hypothetical protein
MPDLPQYFEVDFDVFVKVFNTGVDEVTAINHWGNPYPPIKAMVEGRRVGRATFEKAAENRQGLPTPVRSKAASRASE